MIGRQLAVILVLTALMASATSRGGLAASVDAAVFAAPPPSTIMPFRLPTESASTTPVF